MNKRIKSCEATLCCKATAALKKAVNEELDKEDKSLQDLLNGKDETKDQQ
jgi:hypothetical protein